MNYLSNLTKALADSEFRNKQFDKWGEEKNILFVNPQQSGKHFYKMILPYLALYSKEVRTAITEISKYDPIGQLLGGNEVHITKKMIDWANFIVFPFTTQPLASEIYEFIRESNPSAKIVYQVDFNFYELSNEHPYKYIFSDESIISSVEDNMYFSDIVFTSNLILQKYLVKELNEVIKTKYNNIPSSMVIGCMPIIIDSEIIMENVIFNDLQILQSEKSHHTEEIDTRKKEAQKKSQEIKEVTGSKNTSFKKDGNTKPSINNNSPKKLPIKTPAKKAAFKKVAPKKTPKKIAAKKTKKKVMSHRIIEKYPRKERPQRNPRY